MIESTKPTLGKSDFEAIWVHTHKNTDQINGINSKVAGIEAGQDSLSRQQDSMSRQIDRQFNDLTNAIESNKAPSTPMIPLALLCIGILGLFGTTMTYLTNINASALEREIDLRFQAVNSQGTVTVDAIKTQIAVVNTQISDIRSRMQVDDKREQEDMYDKGIAVASAQSVRNDFNHLDEELHIRHRGITNDTTGIHGRLKAVEQLLKIIPK